MRARTYLSPASFLQALSIAVVLLGCAGLRDDKDDAARGSDVLAIQADPRAQFRRRPRDVVQHSLLNVTGPAHHHKHSASIPVKHSDHKHSAAIPIKHSIGAHVHQEHSIIPTTLKHNETKAHYEDTGGSRAQAMSQMAGLTRLFGITSLLVIIIAAIFEAVHMRWSNVDWARHDTLLDVDPDTLDIGKLGLTGFGSIAWVYFKGDGRVIGLGIFMATCVLIVVGTLIEKQMNFVAGVFWDAMQEKDYEKFLNGLSCFLVMLPGAFLIGAYRFYINGMLSIHWQQSLVQRLQKAWLGHCAYCVGQLRAPYEKIALENPDQRIEEDAYQFVKCWLSLGFGFLQAIPTFVVWMPIVVSLSPEHIFAMKSLPVFRPWLLVAAIVWCLSTSVLTHVMGKNIIIISYAKERYYADFRMGLSRIRHNADQIAMLHAENSEERELNNHFEKIKRSYWERMKIDKIMNIVGFLLGQGSDLFPLIFLAHAYFTGNVGLGHFIRIRMAVSNISDSMSWFVNSYTTIAKFRAVSNRLVEMLEHCEKVSDVRLLAPKLDADMAGGGLRLTSAKGRLPTGTVLWSIEDLAIGEGEWTLIQGSEGSGKTTLLRLLAGAWPVQEGTELRLGGEACPEVRRPPPVKRYCRQAKASKGDTFWHTLVSRVWGAYLDSADAASDCDDEVVEEAKPTLSFVPVGAYRLRAGLHLKKAVCYPKDEEAFCDEAVVEALEAVGLGKLLTGVPSEAEAPEEGTGRQIVAEGPAPVSGSAWPALRSDQGDRMLSAGESQRLELAHVLLTRPRWCFLDEPVSHVGEEERAVLFSTLRSKLKGSSTLVTITHDVTSLASLHDATLELCGGQLRKIVSAA